MGSFVPKMISLLPGAWLLHSASSPAAQMMVVDSWWCVRLAAHPRFFPVLRPPGVSGPRWASVIGPLQDHYMGNVRAFQVAVPRTARDSDGERSEPCSDYCISSFRLLEV